MRRATNGAVLALVLWMLVACTSSVDGSPKPDRPVPNPSVPELQLSDGAVWTSNEYLVHPLDTVWLDGDVVVLSSGGGAKLTAVDLTTGAELWRLDYGGALPGDAGGATFRSGSVVVSDGAVLVPYFQTACEQEICHSSDVPVGDEYGYAALATDSGQLLWKRATIPGVPADSPDDEYLSTLVDAGATVDAGVLVASVKVLSGLAPPTGKPWRYSVGIDVATGAQLWQADGFTAHAANGPTVWGTLSAGDDDAAGVTAALDSTTGSVSWQLTGQEATKLYAGTGSDAALLVEEGAGSPLDVVTADGQQLESPGTNLLWNCPQVPTHGPLACVIDDMQNLPRILTVAGESVVLSEAPVPDSSAVSHVDDAYLYVSTTEDDGRRTSYAADAHGNHLSRDIPGEVVATTGQYLAIFEYQPDGSYPTVAVYTRG